MSEEPSPADGAAGAGSDGSARPARGRTARKQVLLRLDPLVHDALARWAGDELRSANAQIEFLLRRALREAGRLPDEAAPIRRRGRPPKAAPSGTPETPESPTD